MRVASEAEMQRGLIECAQLRGYLVSHFRPAKTELGWRTPVEGNAGFPDLVLARRGTVFVWEIKGPKGRLSTDQSLWLDHLGGIGRMVGPEDYDQAVEALELGRWPD